MISNPRIFVIIPAFNEEGSIGKVVEHIPKGLVQKVIVVNNNSTDNTVEVAEKAGSTVLNQPEMGYGNACLKGIEYARNQEIRPDIVVFLDGDFSDYPEEMPLLIAPILSEMRIW